MTKWLSRNDRPRRLAWKTGRQARQVARKERASELANQRRKDELQIYLDCSCSVMLLFQINRKPLYNFVRKVSLYTQNDLFPLHEGIAFFVYYFFEFNWNYQKLSYQMHFSKFFCGLMFLFSPVSCQVAYCLQQFIVGQNWKQVGIKYSRRKKEATRSMCPTLIYICLQSLICD